MSVVTELDHLILRLSNESKFHAAPTICIYIYVCVCECVYVCVREETSFTLQNIPSHNMTQFKHIHQYYSGL